MPTITVELVEKVASAYEAYLCEDDKALAMAEMADIFYHDGGFRWPVKETPSIAVYCKYDHEEDMHVLR